MKKDKRKKATKKLKPIKVQLRHFLINKLRRASYMWPPRKAAIQKARISRGKYRCASCLGEEFGPKEINVDHINPVIDPHIGWVDFNTFIERLFCDESGWQILCLQCHSAKTLLESFIRSDIKNEKYGNEGEDI